MSGVLKLLEEHTEKEALRIRSMVLARRAKALERRGADPAEIFHSYEDSVELAKATGDRLLVASRLGELATAYRELNRDFEKAIALYDEAMALSGPTQNRSHMVAQLASLAKTHEKAKHFEKAKELYLQALENTSEADVYGMVDRLGTVAHVHYTLSEFDAAVDYYEKALDLARSIQSSKSEAENLDGLGSVLRTCALREKDTAQKSELLHRALACHTKALAIQEGLDGAFHGLANRHQELGRTLLAIGDAARAKEHFIIAVHNARRAPGRRHLEAWQFRRLGEAFERLRQPREAVLCYHKAAQLFGSADPQERWSTEGKKRKLLKKHDPRLGRSLYDRQQLIDEEIERLLAIESPLRSVKSV